MTRTLNTIEAFEIAEQIERNGAKFYRKAAELFGDSDISTLFLDLAGWEEAHEAILAAMRKALPGQSNQPAAFNPEDVPLDPKAMAGLAVFGINPNPSEELTGREDRPQVLNMAIQKEKDSIVYYTGLKEFVVEQSGKDKVDEIIKEEMRHIRILSQSLQQCE